MRETLPKRSSTLPAACRCRACGRTAAVRSASGRHHEHVTLIHLPASIETRVLSRADYRDSVRPGAWHWVEKALNVPMAELDLLPVAQGDRVQVRVGCTIARMTAQACLPTSVWCALPVQITCVPCMRVDQRCLARASCCFSLTPVIRQVVRGEWAGHEGRVLALADEEREAIVDITGCAERTLRAVQRTDCGRVVLLAKRTGGPPGS